MRVSGLIPALAFMSVVSWFFFACLETQHDMEIQAAAEAACTHHKRWDEYEDCERDFERQYRFEEERGIR